MDHPTCHLYVSFPDIQTRPQACLQTEKIQIILEIFHDIVLKSVTCVLVFNEHLMQIKLHSEGPIYRTDFNIQRAPWRVFEHFSWLISLQEKKIISIKSFIHLKKFPTLGPSTGKFNFCWHYLTQRPLTENLNLCWNYFTLWSTFDNSEEKEIEDSDDCYNKGTMGSSFTQEVDFWRIWLQKDRKKWW